MSSKLEATVMSELRHGEAERYVLDDDLEPRLKTALEIDLEAPDRLARVQAVLRLAAAFDGPLRSPRLAEQLRRVLRSSSMVVRLLQEHVLHEKPIDRMRSFVRGEGREVVMRAPMFGQAQRAASRASGAGSEDSSARIPELGQGSQRGDRSWRKN